MRLTSPIPAAVVVLMLSIGVAKAQLSIQPPSPSAFETVRVLAPLSAVGLYDDSRAHVTMICNRIMVTLTMLGAVGVPPPIPDVNVSLGQFPPGNYEVELLRVSGGGISMGTVGTLSFVVTEKAAKAASPTHNFTDLWWNPAESGWGLGITHHPSDVIFATWYVYGPDGKPTWYVMPTGQWIALNMYSGPIYRTTGPPLGSNFNPANVTATQAGTGTLSFSSYSQANFTFNVDGMSGTRAIQRQGF